MLVSLVRRYLRPSTGLLAALVVLQLASSIASLYLPALNADIIDKGVARGDTGYIWRTGGIMLAASFVQMVLSIAAVWCAARIAMGMGRDLRRDIFERVLSFSQAEVSRFGPPSLITRSTNDVQQLQQVVLMGCIMLVSAPMTAIGGVIMAMRQDVGLSWLVAVSVPVLLASIGVVIARMVPLSRLQQTRLDNVNRVMREQITGIRVVRAFTREPLERARFGRANDELTGTALAVGDLMALMFPIVMLVMNLSMVGVLWFGAKEIEAGDMQIGALGAYMTYLIQILMSVMMATMVGTMIPRAAVSAERIGEVLDTRSSVVPPSQPVGIGDVRGTVSLVEAGYAYPGAEEPVLHGVTFTARPGTTTAIVGGTGAGKTTLVKLVPRLFDATAGQVLVDGVDVRDLDPEALWRRVAIVPQRPYLFSGTVASNLRYGNPEATDDELWAALRTAQAEDFVRAFDEGLEHPIAQGGTNVSGGQRQRLCIARALVARPEVYLFDDSFSALDLATDARLRAGLGAYTQGATVITVAQRISTVRDADQIVVLDAGQVVGVGTHDELVQTCPTYAEIVRSQAATQEDAA